MLERVHKKVEELNNHRLPGGIAIKTFYDRTQLIHTTIETVVDILIAGVVLVSIILYIFLGHGRTALIVALTVPVALLFTFCIMVMHGQSANLISLGAIDFGIIVDSTLIMVESIFYHISHKRAQGLTVPMHVMRAAKEVGRPIFFATTIIVVAFMPLFTMTGVPGKIFAPMSLTYGLALWCAPDGVQRSLRRCARCSWPEKCASTIRRSSNGSEKSIWPPWRGRWNTK